MEPAERDQLAEDIKCVQEKQVVADAQLGQVTREKENLAIQVVNLNRRVNSVYYRLDSLKTLKKKGILKSGFLSSAKIKDISSEHFNQSIDLNSSNELVISAEDLGIKKIKDVVLFPRFYKKGSNYKVIITSNGKHALLTLEDKSKFKSKQVVIAVK